MTKILKMKHLLLFLFFLPLTFICQGQNIDFEMPVSIDISGSAINPSAMLDVKSSHKGILIPRLTTIQINAISSPANGLLRCC